MESVIASSSLAIINVLFVVILLLLGIFIIGIVEIFFLRNLWKKLEIQLKIQELRQQEVSYVIKSMNSQVKEAIVLSAELMQIKAEFVRLTNELEGKKTRELLRSQHEKARRGNMLRKKRKPF